MANGNTILSGLACLAERGKYAENSQGERAAGSRFDGNWQKAKRNWQTTNGARLTASCSQPL